MGFFLFPCRPISMPHVVYSRHVRSTDDPCSDQDKWTDKCCNKFPNKDQMPTEANKGLLGFIGMFLTSITGGSLPNFGSLHLPADVAVARLITCTWSIHQDYRIMLRPLPPWRQNGVTQFPRETGSTLSLCRAAKAVREGDTQDVTFWGNNNGKAGKLNNDNLVLRGNVQRTETCSAQRYLPVFFFVCLFFIRLCRQRYSTLAKGIFIGRLYETKNLHSP